MKLSAISTFLWASVFLSLERERRRVEKERKKRKRKWMVRKIQEKKRRGDVRKTGLLQREKTKQQ